MDKTDSILVVSVFAALGAGCVMSLQPAVNGKLATQCTHPLQASLVSFGTGFLALAVVAFFLRTGLPSIGNLVELPWWAWTGGLLGTYMVTVSLLVAPRLGATRWIALVLTGQILLSLALDHFGLVGYQEQRINLPRIIGVLAVALGVVLVMRN